MALRTAKDATPEAIQALAETNLVQAIRINQLEAMIHGLMDAMKPLLDEWLKLRAKAEEEIKETGKKPPSSSVQIPPSASIPSVVRSLLDRAETLIIAYRDADASDFDAQQWLADYGLIDDALAQTTPKEKKESGT